MADYQGGTDQTHRIQLTSTIEQVMWTRTLATPGARVGLTIHTHYVGNGAEMEIALTDHTGAALGTYSNKLYGNHFAAEVVVPQDAAQALYATVELPAHGLEKKSKPLLLLPRIEVRNAQWSQDEARRGDILTLTAEVLNAPDGMEALITVFEHDAEDAHEEITKILTLVDQERVQVDWEFQFAGDVKDIPSDAEAEDGYKPPQFFFRVDALGKTADSGLLTFHDWVEIRLIDADGVPKPNADYVLHLPDGSQREGTLNDEGYAREDDVPPGVCLVVFPALQEPEEESNEA